MRLILVDNIYDYGKVVILTSFPSTPGSIL